MKTILIPEIKIYNDVGYTIFPQGEFFNHPYIDTLISLYNFMDVDKFIVRGKIEKGYIIKEY